ncbi:PREDICTED: uncharacterized protein LOC108614947 [Drosophila arizonae]|uniref:Uncharacterized protein LOC108614947 n=1 Tax=Drosophila arizonae TaxID=7263 RepID=A0ABM1PBR9_DROAR|nr:PREDICTED: uncharacterized protein LOC108614947 [Drosophila arizonae]
MFKSKSFDLKNDEAGKQREHLYQPRKAQWLKYIMQPAAIAFVILLIICNIDFSYDPDEDSARTLSRATSHGNFVPIYNQNLVQLIFSHARNKMDCRDHITLRLENYNFPNGVIKRNSFRGEYTLQSLVLSNCRLRHIVDGTFDQQSLHKLQNLELINTKLKKLTNETLRGLLHLSNFTLINKRKSLSCNGLLLPVAHSLRSVKISLPYTRKIYEPTYFFGQTIYEHLKVLDLSGNNIGEIVEMKAFEHMPALEHLNLANCRLRSIHFDLSNELRYLDLSGNKLTELSVQFMLAARDGSIKLNLAANNWDCSYANVDVFELLNIKPCVESVRKTRELISDANSLGASYDTTEDIQSTYETTIVSTTMSRTTQSSTKQQAPPRTTTPTTTQSSAKQQVPVRTTSSTTTTTEATTIAPTTIAPPTTEPSTWITETTQKTSSDLTTPWDIPVTTESENDENSLLYDDIVCVNAQKENLGSTTIAYNAKMTIVDDSESTVNVILSQFKADVWSIVYFSNAMDKPIFGMLLSVALGVLAVYAILRMRPSWLWGSKRLLRPTSQSNTMLLLPREYEKEAYDAIRSANPNSSIHEYASYYRHLEEAQLYRGGSNKYNVPPIERAPSIPPSVHKNKISTVPNTYTYESFEVYEELY